MFEKSWAAPGWDRSWAKNKRTLIRTVASTRKNNGQKVAFWLLKWVLPFVLFFFRRNDRPDMIWERQRRESWNSRSMHKSTVGLIPVFIGTAGRNQEFLICLIFDQGSQIGKQHIDEKFLKNRNRSSTREFFHGKAAFQLFIFGFHRPAIKIKFLKHCLCDERIKKVGSEIFFCTVIKSDFNDVRAVWSWWFVWWLRHRVMSCARSMWMRWCRWSGRKGLRWSRCSIIF